ncbi:Uncharacterised protein [Salmonella enterica subsp. enterica serovar Bovismorbificans]|uniref:Uncharacterized protein n=1 Tax=Salmonella enterica subsp. enterica serovar Bovismorbificans TaxID=58097 RepID=A0A655CH18_SALET|nr:Uncharacterised protein [Salmonella enterica subsp. enterica serovar Bovismorbificans]
MFHAVVTGLIHYDLLHRFKRVKVKLLWHQSKLSLGVNHVFFQVVTKNVNAPGRFINQ